MWRNGYVPKCVSKILQTLDPSQVLQEAWQAKQVPDPEYMPGMHSLLTQDSCKYKIVFSSSKSKSNFQIVMCVWKAPGLRWQAVPSCLRVPAIPSRWFFINHLKSLNVRIKKLFSNNSSVDFHKSLNLQTSQTPLDFGQESQPEGLRRGGWRT